MRMIARVHRDTAVGGPDSQPTRTAGFADCNVFVFMVADQADAGPAIHMHFPDFAGRKTQQSLLVFLCHQLGGCSGGTNHLSPFADFEFNVVNQGANRNVPKRQCIADFNVRLRATHQLVTDFQSFWRQNVAFFTIRIEQQGNSRRTVRIVLDRCHRGRHAIFRPFEINDPVKPLMAATLVANSQTPLVVASTRTANDFRQRFLRFACGDFIKARYCHLPTSGGIWFKTLYCHE